MLTSKALAVLSSAAGIANAANLLVAHYSGFIFSLSLTPGNGTGPASLAIKSSLQGGGTMPSWLTLDSASGSLLVSDESELATPSPLLSDLQVNADNSVQVISSATGSPGQVHSTFYGGVDGKGFIAVAQYNPSTITNYALPLTNTTRLPQKLVFSMLSGPGAVPDRQDKPHPHSVNLDPTGQFIVAPDLGADLLRVFVEDSVTGELTTCPAAAAAPGDGPRHAAFWVSPTGATKLFVVNELANSVSAWDVASPPEGCLTLTKTQVVSAYPEGQPAPAGSKSAEIHIAGNNVYVSNRNDQTFGPQQDSAATYTIDPATGYLTFVELTNTFTFFPRTFAINNAGDMVAFGGQTSSNVAIVARDSSTGKLGPLIAQLPVGTSGTVNQEDGLSAVIWDG